MFGLKVIRKRKFESNHLLLSPGKGYKPKNAIGKIVTRKNFNGYYGVHGHCMGTLSELRAVMGIDWMTKDELVEAIPPAYTHWLGLQIFQS